MRKICDKRRDILTGLRCSHAPSGGCGKDKLQEERAGARGPGRRRPHWSRLAMMGLDQGGGKGRSEERADFESFQLLLLKSWIWRKPAGLSLVSLTPLAALPPPRCPGVVLVGEVPRGRGGAGPGRRCSPAPTPTAPPLPPHLRATVTGKEEEVVASSTSRRAGGWRRTEGARAGPGKAAAMELWRQCTHWLIQCRVLPPSHRVTWDGAQVCELAQALRDGVLLCQLLNNLLPHAINLREVNLRPQMSQVSPLWAGGRRVGSGGLPRLGECTLPLGRHGNRGDVWVVTLRFWGDLPYLRRNAFMGLE